MAPMARAVPAAARPATPPPIISTYSQTWKQKRLGVNKGVLERKVRTAVSSLDSKHVKHNSRTMDSPTTLTFAGGTFPAAVICPVKKRPKLLAAKTTALYLNKIR